MDRQIDMIEEGFDVAIVVDSMLNSDDVVARRASLSHFVACCTPAYLGSLQAPSTFAELKGHRIFCLRRFAGELPKLESRRVNITGNSAMLRLLALEDAGIVIVPTFLVTDDLSAGRLVKVLQNETLPAVDVWVAYPTRKYVSAKVERFVEAAFTQLVHAG
ncbi:Transcriptional regulator, LysR family [Cupriavidus basilensis]|uniref:Transcriptional regulator, LysR family n=1 Tax=Cupriavidus basilensis TaxID=68895 RepID=A0A0C4Y966_9BURK|nr:Transcriptional regulator, LysR family [Cupriavidus basilensis]